MGGTLIEAELGCKQVQVWWPMAHGGPSCSAPKSPPHATRMRGPFALVSARNRVRPAPLHAARSAAYEESYRDSSPWGRRRGGERNKTDTGPGAETVEGPTLANFVPQPGPCPRAPSCALGPAPPCSAWGARAPPYTWVASPNPRPQLQGTVKHRHMPRPLAQFCALLSWTRLGLRIASMRFPAGLRSPQRTQPGPLQQCTGPQARWIAPSPGPSWGLFSGGPRPRPPWAHPSVSSMDDRGSVADGRKRRCCG